MQRRALQYDSFLAFRRDIDWLREGPYGRAGSWSLGQAAEHLTRVIAMSLDGFPFRVPFVFRLAGPAMRWVTLWRGSIPSGIKGPAEMMPTAVPAGEEQQRVDALLALLDRYEAHTGPLHASPLFGKMTRQQWDRIHLIHAAHHFSFLVPGTPA